jgi:glycosyltransferase involved in cell wall biosynthesis
MVPEILLSICIPTYNRATYLEKCLQSIVQQVGNNPQVEIIISDNVSNDNTGLLCKGFAEQFDNVKYFANETNIGADKNIIRVLNLARGKYLKLLNDYVEFKDACVLKMLEIIKKHLESKEVLFFSNGLSHLKKKEFHYSKNLDEFVRIASDRSTWISAFGIWKEDFLFLIENQTFKTTNLAQTELLFNSVDLRKKAVTYSREIFVIHEMVNKKTGYNFFHVFVNDYFNTIIGGLKNESRISHLTYWLEKNRFFSNFIWMWFKKIKIKNDKSIEYNTEGMFKIIFDTYKYDPIFYLYLIFLPFYLLSFHIKKALRK